MSDWNYQHVDNRPTSGQSQPLAYNQGPLLSPPTPAASAPSRRLVPILAAVGLLVIAGVVAAGVAFGYNKGYAAGAGSVEASFAAQSASASAKTLKLEGSMTIIGSNNWEASGSGCQGTSGYDDLNVGTPVIVYDGSNNNAGAGSLQTSEIDGSSCVISFTIPDVIAGSNVYLVEISHRGKLKADLVGDTLTYMGSIGN